METKHDLIKITTTEQYLIPQGGINGWSLEEVVKNWFTKHINTYHHAARDNYRVGNSKTFEGYELIKVITDQDIRGRHAH